MNKKTGFQLGLLALVIGVGIYMLAGQFKPAKIEIISNIHPARTARNTPNPYRARPQFEIAFGFDQKCKLTKVKVVPLEAYLTNRLAHPLWHLVASSNAVPSKSIIYGQGIRGLRPAVLGKRADPLEPGVTYRLLIEAGSQTGECDFKLPVLPAAR